MKIEVTGSSSQPYIVDTEALTCTCPHFRYRCTHHSIDSDERLCKHLTQVLLDYPDLRPKFMKNNDNITNGFKLDPDGKVRYPRSVFDPYVTELKSMLSNFINSGNISKFEFCGSYRRLAPRVSDLDILIVLTESGSLDAISNYCELLGYQKRWRGNLKSTYVIDGFIQVDFKVVPEDSWAFALLHYTGSKSENIRLRRLANSFGLRLNEYGIVDDNDINCLAAVTEKDIYKFLNTQYLDPWLR